MADVLFRPTDGGYLATYIELELEFALEHLHWERYELHGQLAVSCGLPGARCVNGTCLVSAASFNVSSRRGRKEHANYLSERIRAKGLDLIGMLEEVCDLTLSAERRGEPAIVLRDLPRPAPDEEFDVDGFRLPKHHATIGFGDGGTAKSLHALYTLGVLAQRGVRTAFVDWELDAGVQRTRAGHLFGTDMPEVRYVRCEKPLIHEVDRLKRIVHDERLEFLVFDSVGFACAGPPEAAEAAMDYFRAVRRLGVGSYHIAHVRQGENNDQRPFGSTFWHNAARSTWFIRLGETAPATATRQRITIGLFNRKSNLSALRAAVGFEIWFDQDRITFERATVAEMGDLAESLPLWQRMQATLTRARAPLTLARLAEDLGAQVDTLDRTVRRKTGLFTRVSSEDGIVRIALVANRVA